MAKRPRKKPTGKTRTKKDGTDSDADSNVESGGGDSQRPTNPFQATSLGEFIRAQREMADLSLRQLSTMAEISNAYLSQIERDLHEPSLRVIKSVGNALGIAPETLLSRAGLLPDDDEETEAPAAISTEEAIMTDDNLTEDEKNALLSVYRSYVANKE